MADRERSNRTAPALFQPRAGIEKHRPPSSLCCVAFPGGNAFAVFFHSGNVSRSSARARKRERTFICKAIEHTACGRMLGNHSIVRPLVKIEACLLRVQKIDIELQAVYFDFDLGGSAAAQNTLSQVQTF